MATSGLRTVGKEAADGLYESSQAPSTRLDAYLPASEWLCVYLFSSHTNEANGRFIDGNHVVQLQVQLPNVMNRFHTCAEHVVTRPRPALTSWRVLSGAVVLNLRLVLIRSFVVYRP